MSKGTHHVDRRSSQVSGRRVVSVVAVIALLAMGWFAFQGWTARSALNEAASLAPRLQQQVVEGKAGQANSTLDQLQQAADRAHGRTDGILWDVASKIPWVGDDVGAVQVVAEELDHVASKALPPLVGLTGEFNAESFAPRDGQFDLTALNEAAPQLATSAEALQTSRKRLDGIAEDDLFGPLTGSIEDARDKVGRVASLTQSANLAAQLLPSVLGSEGTQRHMLLIQNNAEIRSTGGMPGSFAIIEADDGRLRILNQGTALDLKLDESDVPALTDDEASVFPSTTASELSDVTITPHFPRAAELAAGLYEQESGQAVDGVVTIDPVALGYLLEGLGTIGVQGEELSGDNAADVLLNKVYQDVPDEKSQNDFFNTTTEAVFDRFTRGARNQTKAMRGLARGVAENRIAFWSANDEQQALIANTEVSGSFGPDKDSAPRIGVFLSDAASTKMEYFLRYETEVEALECADDRQRFRLTTTLTSSAPDGGLAKSVTGKGAYIDQGSMRLNMRTMSPTGGQIEAISLDGESFRVNSDRWTDRNVSRLDVILKPGQTREVVAVVASGAGQTDDAIFTITPGIGPVDNDRRIASSCE